MRLEGRRVLVLGASSGIGRGTSLAIAAEGGRVALAARRIDRLEEAVAEAGENAIAVACDAGDEASVNAAVATAVERFGGLDAVVYTPGIGVFKPIAEIDQSDWRRAFDTNLIGASLLVRAAIGHLEATRGKVVFVSSIVIDDSPPRPKCAPYVVSKVALESLASAWQGEHRSVGFTTIAMGDTATEFGYDDDPAVLLPITEQWIAQGYLYGRIMEVSAVANQIVSALASPETVRRIAITPVYGDDDVVEETLGKRTG